MDEHARRERKHVNLLRAAQAAEPSRGLLCAVGLSPVFQNDGGKPLCRLKQQFQVRTRHASASYRASFFLFLP